MLNYYSFNCIMHVTFYESLTMQTLKKLGEGWFGVVYLCEDIKRFGSKLLAVKKEKVLYNTIVDYEQTGEFKFYKMIETLPLEQQRYFTILLDYNVIEYNGITGMQDFTGHINYWNNPERFRLLDESNNCLITVMEYAGESMANKILTKDHLSQILNIIDIVHDKHYILKDLWLSNLCLYKQQVKLIDYGELEKINPDNVNDVYNQKYDILSFLRLCVNHQLIFEHILMIQPPTEFIPDNMKAIYNSKRYPTIKKYMKRIYPISITSNIKKILDDKSMVYNDILSVIEWASILWIIFDFKTSSLYWKKYYSEYIPRLVSQTYLLQILKRYFPPPK